jgi:hypothetical protein
MLLMPSDSGTAVLMPDEAADNRTEIKMLRLFLRERSTC